MQLATELETERGRESQLQTEVPTASLVGGGTGGEDKEEERADHSHLTETLKVSVSQSSSCDLSLHRPQRRRETVKSSCRYIHLYGLIMLCIYCVCGLLWSLQASAESGDGVKGETRGRWEML